jgi:hypothetical protein
MVLYRGKKFFSSPTFPDRLWGPCRLMFNGYPGALAPWVNCRCLKLNTCLRRVLRLRMSGVISSLSQYAFAASAVYLWQPNCNSRGGVTPANFPKLRRPCFSRPRQKCVCLQLPGEANISYFKLNECLVENWFNIRVDASKYPEGRNLHCFI